MWKSNFDFSLTQISFFEGKGVDSMLCAHKCMKKCATAAVTAVWCITSKSNSITGKCTNVRAREVCSVNFIKSTLSLYFTAATSKLQNNDANSSPIPKWRYEKNTHILFLSKLINIYANGLFQFVSPFGLVLSHLINHIISLVECRIKVTLFVMMRTVI